MSSITENKRIADVVLFEEPTCAYSRDEITLVAGSGAITIGEVLGKITASGKYTPLDTTAEDGSQTAAAVALEKVTVAASTDSTSVALLRHAVVKDGGLDWPAGISAGDKTTAKAALKALGILIRTDLGA